jgi:hypothetical protein
MNPIPDQSITASQLDNPGAFQASLTIRQYLVQNFALTATSSEVVAVTC